MQGLWNVCKNCLKCCLHGSPLVLPRERKLIIKKTKKDCFVAQENGKYFTIGSPKKKKACPYLLEDGKCLLHNLGCKPVDCRTWPIGLTPEGEFIVDIDCPAVGLLSDDDYLEAKKILEKALNTPELRRSYYKLCREGGFRTKVIKLCNVQC